VSAAARLGGPAPPVRAEHRMSNAERHTVTLLVEADPDARFWRMWVDRQACRVRPPDDDRRGREAVREELRKAREAGLPIVAVVDADLDRLRGLAPGEGEVWTDAHDLEATLLALPGLLAKVVAVAGAPDGGGRLSEPGWLFAACAFPGRLRALQAEPDSDALAVRLQKEGRRGAVERFEGWAGCLLGDLTLDADALLRALVGWHNQQRMLQALPALRARAEAVWPDAAPDQLCNGHDLVGVLRASLVKLKAKAPDAEGLTRELMLACERAWVDATAMAAALRAWVAARPGYRIFPDP